MTEPSFDGTNPFDHDRKIDSMLTGHFATYHITPLEALKIWPVLVRRQWLKRFLAHHELFIKTLHIPGDIAELGVFRGAGLMTWANLLESYCVGDRTKRVLGFDNWTGFPELKPEDGREIPGLQKQPGGYSPAKDEEALLNAINIFDADRFCSWKARILLYRGNIEESVPKFCELNPGVRFSLVHFDCDLYEPTKTALRCLWDRVVRGGVVVFDEYGIPQWPGETQAVDEFFGEHPELNLQTFTYTNAPGAFLIKP